MVCVSFHFLVHLVQIRALQLFELFMKLLQKSKLDKMSISGFRFLFIFATFVHHASASSCGGEGVYVGDGTGESFLPNNATEFQKNLQLVLEQLPTKTSEISSHSWAGVSSGYDPNAAYAQARCIGYVDKQTCLDCIKEATAAIIKECFREALSSILWHNGYICMVQYSIHNVLGIIQMPDDMIRVKNDTGDVDPPLSADAFFRALTKLSDKLVSITKNDKKKLAVGKWYDGSSNETIFGIAQCSWDLSAEQCDNCLTIVSKKLREYFDGKVGGSIMGPSCNFRFEIYNFLNDTSLRVDDLSPPLPTPPSSTSKRSNKGLPVMYIGAPLALISVILFFGICIFLRKKKHNKRTREVEVETVGKINDEDDSSSGPDIKTEDTLLYDFASIRAATENFSEAYKLGQGGFGVVYKGKLQNGDEIAVKRLSQSSKQGDLEFTNEVTLLARLQHRNLVRLLGFCLKRKERLLIYEFVANSSLDNYIFDPIKRAQLNWDQIYKIIVGVARGLLYLHEDSRLRIIHRDLKSSNILLDNEMTPKIADFGMARLFLSDETQGTSKIVGTYGYMAPEYLLHGLFSIKSDVFSFGVLILEIICGHRNTSFRVGNSVENLLSYAWKSWQDGTVSDLIDPTLISETSDSTRCIQIGLLCAQEDATDRPTMASVVNMLSNLSSDLTVPSKPFFQQCSVNQKMPLLQDYDSGRTGNSSGSKNKSSSSWTTDTEMHPR